MRRVIPTGSQEWDTVAVTYTRCAKENGRKERDSNFLKKYYTSLIKTNKPTGDPELPWEVKEARRVERLIAGKVELFVGDESDLDPDSDNEVVTHEQEDHDKYNAPQHEMIVVDPASFSHEVSQRVVNATSSQSSSQLSPHSGMSKKVVMSVERASRQKPSVASQSSQVMQRLMQMTERTFAGAANDSIASVATNEDPSSSSSSRFQRLEARVDKLEDRNDKLHEENKSLRLEVDRLNALNLELRHQLLDARAQQQHVQTGQDTGEAHSGSLGNLLQSF
ncbi:hypothetical protein EDC01DRAFT_780711 [Geopyxis carbonaria]|nr:hypothetical protein EDC01DRAFT_780711 [Geopyxis carbonaria]